MLYKTEKGDTKIILLYMGERLKSVWPLLSNDIGISLGVGICLGKIHEKSLDIRLCIVKSLMMCQKF